MSYTDATLHEILRHSCLVYAIPHSATENVRISSYDIPRFVSYFFMLHKKSLYKLIKKVLLFFTIKLFQKSTFSGTAIYANLWAVMHDKYYWKDPNEFRPERFLDSDGQFQRDDRCVPFSLGKRYCIGQVRLNSFALFDNYV